MRLVLHPQVYSNIDKIMKYYETTTTAQLTDDFYVELQNVMVKTAKQPESFSIRERDVRRVNLERFPYHFLFRIVGEAVRVLVVRHHRRHPSFGTWRR